MEPGSECFGLANETKMKKHLVILHTEKHTEIIHTNEPQKEIERLIALYKSEVVSIMVDNQQIYIKNGK